MRGAIAIFCGFMVFLWALLTVASTLATHKPFMQCVTSTRMDCT